VFASFLLTRLRTVNYVTGLRPVKGTPCKRIDRANDLPPITGQFRELKFPLVENLLAFFLILTFVFLSNNIERISTSESSLCARVVSSKKVIQPCFIVFLFSGEQEKIVEVAPALMTQYEQNR
jgi:hypothetical protein